MLSDDENQRAVVGQMLLRLGEQPIDHRLARTNGRIGQYEVEHAGHVLEAVALNHLGLRAVARQIAPAQLHCPMVHIRHHDFAFGVFPRQRHAHRAPAAA